MCFHLHSSSRVTLIISYHNAACDTSGAGGLATGGTKGSVAPSRTGDIQSKGTRRQQWAVCCGGLCAVVGYIMGAVWVL